MNSKSVSIEPFKNENGNIVMGIVRTLEYEDIHPFLSTLHATKYEGGVTLFCDDISQRTRDIFSSMGIFLRDFKEKRITIPFLGKKVNAYRLFSPLQRIAFYVMSKEAQHAFASTAFHIHQSRHFLYTAFLEEHPQVGNVMLSDTRDVVFQRDPFDFPINDSLCCFLEDPGMSISKEPHNSNWIRRGFGEEALQTIGHHTISCAGITIGSASAIHAYTSEMCSILLSPRVRAIAGITGLDQGIHNYSIRMNLFGDRLRMFENMNGPVMTMGLMKNDDMSFQSETGLILNNDGSICHTIHQYDRHPELLTLLPERILAFNSHNNVM